MTAKAVRGRLLVWLKVMMAVQHVATPRFNSFMHMLGRKKGMMIASSCRNLKDPFLSRSKWCHPVLAITRTTKLIGTLRLKIFWIVVNSRSIFDHSETNNREYEVKTEGDFFQRGQYLQPKVQFFNCSQENGMEVQVFSPDFQDAYFCKEVVKLSCTNMSSLDQYVQYGCIVCISTFAISGSQDKYFCGNRKSR